MDTLINLSTKFLSHLSGTLVGSVVGAIVGPFAQLKEIVEDLRRSNEGFFTKLLMASIAFLTSPIWITTSILNGACQGFERGLTTGLEAAWDSSKHLWRGNLNGFLSHLGAAISGAAVGLVSGPFIGLYQGIQSPYFIVTVPWEILTTTISGFFTGINRGIEYGFKGTMTTPIQLAADSRHEEALLHLTESPSQYRTRTEFHADHYHKITPEPISTEVIQTRNDTFETWRARKNAENPLGDDSLTAYRRARATANQTFKEWKMEENYLKIHHSQRLRQ